MRFQVGEEIYAIHFKLAGHTGLAAGGYVRPYIYTDAGVEKITIKKLVVKEHHKVPWDQDPDGEKKYDGYVLTDEKGVVWHNQYEKASYGQVSDTANWMFNLALTGDHNISYLRHSGTIHEMEAVTVFYNSLAKGIEFHRNNGNDPSYTAKLVALSDDIKKMLKDEFGKELQPYDAYPSKPGIVIHYKIVDVVK